MPKNFKKLLVCIVATFGITAMVFSCCKKVGLCASSSSTVPYNPLPLLWGSGIGSSGDYSQSLLLNILDDAITRTYSYESGKPVVIIPYGSGNTLKLRVFFPNQTPTLPSDFSVGSSFNIHYGRAYDYLTDGTFSSSYTNNNVGIFYSQIFEELNGSLIYKFGVSAQYPIYIYNQSALVDSNGTQIFSDNVNLGPQGHSKGGVLSNYIDSDSLIESSSDLPKVDTTPPADTSSNAGWFQKILNGIGKVNQSIQGGVLTIGDYLGSMAEKIGEWFQNTIDSIEGFFGRVEDKLDDVIDSIQDLFDGTTVSQAQIVWQDEFNNSVFKDFVDLKSTIETDILTPIKNANAPSNLSFTIPLITINVPRLVNTGGNVSTSTNNVYLFGQSVTLDFSWYTRSISGGVFNGSSIRDYLVPIIATFLYVGMVVHLLFKIPSFLSGSSGFSNTLHSVVVSNNGSKFKKA